MRLFAANLKLDEKRCVVVGGGKVAVRKVAALLESGAHVTVISPEISPELLQVASGKSVEILNREYRTGDLSGAVVAIAATDNEEINRQVFEEGRQSRVSVNVVDRPDLCDFHVPSCLRRGHLQIAVSTDGRFPGFAGQVRRQLEEMLGPEYEEYMDLLAAFRDRIRASGASREIKNAVEQKLLAIPVLEDLRNGRSEDAVAAFEYCLRSLEAGPPNDNQDFHSVETVAEKTGVVGLVGAGPGDPDLITVKGLRCISEADVIVYDHLVSPVLLTKARSDTELICAGKSAGKHSIEQEETNRILLAKAREGKRVCRLKGGDPVLFGRGGEEALFLRQRGVPFEIVPGVTSAIAVPAYAGIPVTHRGIASSVRIITGHEGADAAGGGLDWAEIATTRGTLVFLMCARRVGSIADLLMTHGMEEHTLAAVISKGTTKVQRTVTGCLSDIGERAERASLDPPALMVVGEVVSLHDQMDWFDPSSE